MKIFISVLIFLSCQPLFGQGVLSHSIERILKDQIKMHKHQKSAIKRNYTNLATQMKLIKTNFLYEVHYLESSFNPKGDTTLNLYVSMNDSWGEFNLVFWWSDTYYVYNLSNKVHLSSKNLAELVEDDKEIPTSFTNWDQPLFMRAENDTFFRRRGNDISGHYFASKLNVCGKHQVQSIAFKY